MIARNSAIWALRLGVGTFVWVGGCSSRSSDGITIAVDVEHARPAPLVSGAGTVVLTRGYVSLGTVEIFECADAAASWTWPFTLREARAHVVGSPTRLGSPFVEALVPDAAERIRIGALHPPPAAYCRIRQTVLAADRDAPGLPPDGTMVGKSLLVEGSYTAPGAGPRAFRFVSTKSFDAETTVDAFSLSSASRSAASVVLLRTSDRWFEGVDLDGPDDRALATLIDNVRASLGARIE